jgi:hypothetical protein
MELEVLSIASRSVNAGCLNLVAWLMREAPDFGGGIYRMRIEPHFESRTDSPEYRKELAKFPIFRFSRRNKNLTIKYVCKTFPAEDLLLRAMVREPEVPFDNRSAWLFREFYKDLLQVLEEMRKVIKPADSFDVDQFLQYARDRYKHIPKTNEGMWEMWQQSLYRPTQGPSGPAEPLDPAQRMSEDEFWNLIDQINRYEMDGEHGKKAVAPLIKKLSKLSPDRIRSFQNLLQQKLYALDTLAHARGARETSDDAFVYVRCYVLGNGRVYYERALAEPQFMPVDPPWFEELLYAASEAWAKATGDEPSNFPHQCEKSFWTGSNEAGWPEEAN